MRSVAVTSKRDKRWRYLCSCRNFTKKPMPSWRYRRIGRTGKSTKSIPTEWHELTPNVKKLLLGEMWGRERCGHAQYAAFVHRNSETTLDRIDLARLGNLWEEPTTNLLRTTFTRRGSTSRVRISCPPPYCWNAARVSLLDAFSLQHYYLVTYCSLPS